jgi:hypothetical protein
MPSAGFEFAIPGSELPHTHALHRAFTGIGIQIWNYLKNLVTMTLLTFLIGRRTPKYSQKDRLFVKYKSGVYGLKIELAFLP